MSMNYIVYIFSIEVNKYGNFVVIINKRAGSCTWAGGGVLTPGAVLLVQAEISTAPITPMQPTAALGGPVGVSVGGVVAGGRLALRLGGPGGPALTCASSPSTGSASAPSTVSASSDGGNFLHGSDGPSKGRVGVVGKLEYGLILSFQGHAGDSGPDLLR